MAKKAVEVKETVEEVKAAPAAEVKAEVKEETAKEPAKKTAKPAAKKTAAEKKAPAKKTEAKKPAAEKKAPAKRAAKAADEKKENVVVQFAGKEFTVEELVELAKADFKANNKGYIRKLDVYVKPEDSAAYYVVNGKTEGKVIL